MFITNNTA